MNKTSATRRIGARINFASAGAAILPPSIAALVRAVLRSALSCSTRKITYFDWKSCSSPPHRAFAFDISSPRAVFVRCNFVQSLVAHDEPSPIRNYVMAPFSIVGALLSNLASIHKQNNRPPPRELQQPGFEPLVPFFLAPRAPKTFGNATTPAITHHCGSE